MPNHVTSPVGLLNKPLNHIDNLFTQERWTTFKKLLRGFFLLICSTWVKWSCHQVSPTQTAFTGEKHWQYVKTWESNPQRKKERKGRLSLRRTSTLLLLFCPGPRDPRRCFFHGRRSLSVCRKLEAGIPWVPSSSSYLRRPARAFTPQQSSTATSNSDLWTCYAISTCYGRKAPAAQAGLSSETRRARRRTDTALFRGRLLYRRACSQFSMREQVELRRYLTPSKVSRLLLQ